MTAVAHALPVAEVHHARVAWWWSRVVAVVLDSAVLAALAWLTLGTDASAPRLWPGLGPVSGTDAAPWTSSAVLVGAVAALAALQAWTGATPGKRAVGIVVVDAVTGRPVGMLRTLLRQLAHLLDAFLLLGYVRAGLDVHGRTFADQVVGTRVLAARRPPGWAPPSGPSAVGRGLTVAAVVLVVLGVGGAFPTWSAGGSSRTLGEDCVVPPETGLVAEVVREVHWTRERRFGWWERTRVDPSGVTVQWWGGAASMPLPPTEISVVATDLDDGRTWTTTAPADDDGAAQWSLTLPRVDTDGVERLGLEARLRTAVGEVATCSAVVDLRGTDVAPARP
ncbi:RDD family protein [Cellulomonas sp. NPDC057328]|uniref:RDD family protein n=1 Tax=Cellulomonas sp. NPDC057328 TaxID=3346101 RepID=UPI0036362076